MEFVRALKALADPQRLRILAAVSEEELTVGRGSKIMQSAQSAVSRNFRFFARLDWCRTPGRNQRLFFRAHDMPESARQLFQSLQSRPRGHSRD